MLLGRGSSVSLSDFFLCSSVDLLELDFLELRSGSHLLGLLATACRSARRGCPGRSSRSAARRHAQRGVASRPAAFSPKIARSRRFSSGASIGLSPFGVILPIEDIAGLHLGADADDAVVVEVLERLLTDVRNVTGDFLRSELGVARGDFEFGDVDGGVDVLASPSRSEITMAVLEVVAVPGHEGDQHVACRVRARPCSVVGTVGDARRPS